MEIQIAAVTMRNSRRFPQNIETELPPNPAISFLGKCPKKTKSVSQRDFYKAVFTTAGFTIAETGKAQKCSLTYEWIK